MKTKQLQNILVKPAGPDCNMACAYCFYSGKTALFPEAAVHRMDDSVLCELMRQFMELSGPNVSITWQGGEPTLMGLPFFRRAVELEELFGRGKTVGNGIQTNGLLIDGEWAEFFRRYSFLVGLSIDGPGHVHDHYRRRAGGQATWNRVSDVARLLLDAGVSVNALSVVTDYAAGFPDEIYEFLRDIGLAYMQFITCLEPDAEDSGSASSFSVSPSAYGDFLCRMYDLWRSDFQGGRPTTSIRFFESLLFSYAGFPPPECTLTPECGNYVVVEHNGDVYSCDFYVEPDWRLGNVMSGRLDGMLNSSVQKDFGMRKSELADECYGCAWLRFCRGGCPRDRRLGTRPGRLNYYCSSFKQFFSHADAGLKELVGQWRKSQVQESRPVDMASGRVGRNEPCPCGSGLKYKRCCGA